MDDTFTHILSALISIKLGEVGSDKICSENMEVKP
jgi:hypothetical protein